MGTTTDIIMTMTMKGMITTITLPVIVRATTICTPPTCTFWRTR
jgi:hypothetical protein